MKSFFTIMIFVIAAGANAADLSNTLNLPNATENRQLVHNFKGANSIQVKGESMEECYEKLINLATILNKSNKVLVQTIRCGGAEALTGTIYFF